MHGAVEKDNRHVIHTEDGFLEELNPFGFLQAFEDDTNKYNAEISRHCVRQKIRSIFWDLPYWRTT